MLGEAVAEEVEGAGDWTELAIFFEVERKFRICLLRKKNWDC